MATNVGNVVFSISADLKNIQGQLRALEGNFQSSFSKIEGIAKNAATSLLSVFGVGLGAGALAGFGKEILALADNLQNLSDQTHISVELLSGIKSPLEEAGTSMDAFAKGVFKFQTSLGNAGDDADAFTRSVARLGLNVNDLRNSSPDDFIKKITDALAKVENPVERNTILFNLLGKSAKELGPALQQLVGRFDELRAKGLSAADVKALDDIGDSLTRMKNQALLLGAEGVAGILRFFGAVRDVPKLGSDLDAATQKAASLFGLPKGRVEGMTSKEIIAQAEIKTKFADNPQALRMARDELLNLREEFDRVNGAAAKTPIAPFKGMGDSAKKAKNDVDNFLEGLQKQLSALEIKNTEARFGPAAALATGLDAQLAAFKDNLRDKQLPIPKGLDVFFGVLKDKILAANTELVRTQFELKRIDDLGNALSQDSAEWLNVSEDLEKAKDKFKPFLDQFAELRQQLLIDTIDTSTPAGSEQKRVAQILADYGKTAQKIQDLARQAGKGNEESAEVTSLAWTKALGEIQNKTDEITEFQRRAMERGFDAGGDLLKDALGGQIKTWEDFRGRVAKVIDGIAADWLTLQAKTLLLGPNFGTKAGGTQVGGLLGEVGGFVGKGFDFVKSLAFHEGGVVGVGGSPRTVNLSAYAYAPRYHKGIDYAGGEMPAILKRGEEVGWPAQLAAKYGGGGGTVIHIHQPNFSDRRSEAQVLARIGAAIDNGKRNR